MSDLNDAELETPGVTDIDRLVDLWSTLVDSQRVYGANLEAARNEDVARQYFGRLLLEDGVRVAAVDDTFVGFVSFELERDQFHRERTVGLVENLFVRSHYRNVGIGTALLAEAERALRERGADSIQLEVLAANAAAQSFYEDRGYTLHRVRYAKDVETDNDNATDPE